MNKSLLVLAASRYQLDVIRKARALGHRVITLDNCPSNPGHAEADSCWNIDTTDMNAALDVALRENVDGIVSPCTDVAAPTAAFIANRMGLPGPPFESVKVACSKVRFREFLSRNGMPAPEAMRIDADFRPAEDIFKKSRWIMKPDQCSGSKGIFVIESQGDYRRRLPETLEFSPQGVGILERFIEGFQGTCEGVLRNGRIEQIFLLDRMTAEPPYVATRGHCFPTTLPVLSRERLLHQLHRVWSLMGISDGPFDCDFVASEQEVYILELSPRLGGNCISKLLQAATGFDIVEYAIRYALGENPKTPAVLHLRPTAAVILGVQRGGRLAFDREEAECLKREPWVLQLSLDVAFGATVFPFINGRNRIGEALIAGSARNELELRVLELYQRLSLIVED